MDLHRLLARQLRKLGLDADVTPDDEGRWRALLETVDRTYATADQDRYTLERSLRLSSEEMLELNERLQARYDEMERLFFQAQRLESIGRLAGGVAHDFNNILGVILGCAELLKAQLGESPLQEDVADVMQAAQRGAELTRQLLAFSRREVVRPQVIDLDEAIRTVERMLRTTIGERVELEIVRRGGEALVEIDPTQAEQVLVNLAVNARDAMALGGVLRFTTGEWTQLGSRPPPHPDLTPGAWVVLTVEDDGTGMPPDVLDRVFEPFFTTKERGRGTGMGLATVYGIVRQAGGHILVESEVGSGSTFRIWLPRATGRPVEDARAETSVRPQARGHTVLVLEDEAALLKVLTKVLEAEGYHVLQAMNEEQALTAADTGGGIDLILSDVVMPGRSGPEIVDRLRTMGCTARVIYMSGYPVDAIDQDGVLPADVHLIHKPFDNVTLVRVLEELLSGETAPAVGGIRRAF